jgi:hypothetical protein
MIKHSLMRTSVIFTFNILNYIKMFNSFIFLLKFTFIYLKRNTQVLNRKLQWKPQLKMCFSSKNLNKLDPDNHLRSRGKLKVIQ